MASVIVGQRLLLTKGSLLAILIVQKGDSVTGNKERGNIKERKRVNLYEKKTTTTNGGNSIDPQKGLRGRGGLKEGNGKGKGKTY